MSRDTRSSIGLTLSCITMTFGFALMIMLRVRPNLQQANNPPIDQASLGGNNASVFFSSPNPANNSSNNPANEETDKLQQSSSIKTPFKK